MPDKEIAALSDSHLRGTRFVCVAASFAAGFNSASGAILATVGVRVVNVGMTILAMFLVDRAGRRPLLLVGIAGMIIRLGVLGLSFRYPYIWLGSL